MAASESVRWPAYAASIYPARRRRTPAGLISAGILICILVLTIAGPLLWQRSPIEHQVSATLQNPSLQYPLGTDQFGRDILARILTGARWTLLGAATVSLGISGVGLVIGALAATSRRAVDLVLSRIVEALMALPGIVVALALTSILGPSFRNLLLAMVLAGWPWYARAYRAIILKERDTLYVEGAVAAGASQWRVIVRHIAPNIFGPVIVLATANLGFVILNLAALSFLGIGIQPPTPEWGAMISESRLYFQQHPWQMLAPGLCIVVTVLAINIFGDILRDIFDPRTR